jgi:hypothetical protein
MLTIQPGTTSPGRLTALVVELDQGGLGVLRVVGEGEHLAVDDAELAAFDAGRLIGLLGAGGADPPAVPLVGGLEALVLPGLGRHIDQPFFLSPQGLWHPEPLPYSSSSSTTMTS